jgi:hypothetical protein
MLCLGFLIAFSCQAPQAAPDNSARFCKVYQPVRWSHSDTRGTKEQVDALNRVWKAQCRSAAK